MNAKTLDTGPCDSSRASNQGNVVEHGQTPAIVQWMRGFLLSLSRKKAKYIKTKC